MQNEPALDLPDRGHKLARDEQMSNPSRADATGLPDALEVAPDAWPPRPFCCRDQPTGSLLHRTNRPRHQRAYGDVQLPVTSGHYDQWSQDEPRPPHRKSTDRPPLIGGQSDPPIGRQLTASCAQPPAELTAAPVPATPCLLAGTMSRTRRDSAHSATRAVHSPRDRRTLPCGFGCRPPAVQQTCLCNNCRMAAALNG